MAEGGSMHSTVSLAFILIVLLFLKNWIIINLNNMGNCHFQTDFDANNITGKFYFN